MHALFCAGGAYQEYSFTQSCTHAYPCPTPIHLRYAFLIQTVAPCVSPASSAPPATTCKSCFAAFVGIMSALALVTLVVVLRPKSAGKLGGELEGEGEGEGEELIPNLSTVRSSSSEVGTGSSGGTRVPGTARPFPSNESAAVAGAALLSIQGWHKIAMGARGYTQAEGGKESLELVPVQSPQHRRGTTPAQRR